MNKVIKNATKDREKEREKERERMRILEAGLAARAKPEEITRAIKTGNPSFTVDGVTGEGLLYWLYGKGKVRAVLDWYRRHMEGRAFPAKDELLDFSEILEEYEAAHAGADMEKEWKMVLDVAEKLEED